MTQFDDIIVTPVYGPLTTSNYPTAIPYHSYGVLTGKHPNPPQFYPSNGSSEFSNARREYIRTATKLNNPYGVYPKDVNTTDYYPSSSFNYIPVDPVTGKPLYAKYNQPVCSSLYTSARKRNSVGKSSLKTGLPNSAPLSYKNYNTNDVKKALRITRAGGCTAPAKKGSIYNNSLRNGQVCAWGSLVRQNY